MPQFQDDTPSQIGDFREVRDWGPNGEEKQHVVSAAVYKVNGRVDLDRFEGVAAIEGCWG
jgi:hypothetical protein